MPTGYFDLDPNRVLDLTLEAMEQQIWNTSYLALLKRFQRASVAHILGFRLTQYHKQAQDTAAAAGDAEKAPAAPAPSPAAPSSLYTLVAVLLTADIISLSQMIPYLSPSIEETAVEASKKRRELEKEIRAHGSYSLSAKAPQETKSKDKSTKKVSMAHDPNFCLYLSH